MENPERWSSKTPNLYRCVVILGKQIIAECFGNRSPEWVDNRPFKLKGEHLLFKGAHYHEDNAGAKSIHR